MKPALNPLKRALRDLFQVEPLEARVLLSADPVLGAVQVAIAPGQDPAAQLSQAYQAPADIKVTTTPDSTVLVADNAQQPAGSQWLLVDTAQLADGNGRVVVGGPDSNAVIHVGTAGSTLQLGDLVLVNPQNGGEIHMDGALNLSGNLFVQGSGHTSYITSDVTAAGQVSYSDSMVVTGNRTIQAGTGGTGSIQLGTTATHMLNGDGDGNPDSLTLQAADNVLFAGTVGGTDPLEGISIGAVSVGGTPNRPDNVSFDNEVTVNGDLVIDAGGTVTFTRKVILTSGGDLRITGASSVVFQAGLELQGTDAFGNAGDIFIEANEIDFQGGTESVKGAGLLTLRPTTVGYGIDVGSLPASVTQPQSTTLNLDTSELKALADGFSKIVIGQQDGLHANAAAGNVRIGAIDALSQPTMRDPLEVYGGSISVEDLDNADYTFLVQGTLLLDAHANITIANKVEANPGTGVTDITLYSDTGSVQQVDATGDLVSAEPLRAATLTVHAATGISLPYTEIATLSATNSTSGGLSITETASGGDVAIALLSQQAASAGISVTTTAGNITVGGTGIANAGSGATQLQAGGTGKNITVNQDIHSASGTIRLTATGAITTDDDAGVLTHGVIATDGAAAIELTASGGAIQQGADISSAGGLVSLDASGVLTMKDGVRTSSLDAAGDTGAVALRARGGNVTVSAVQADGSMSVTASGAIIDGLTGTNPNLDGETAAVLLAAASGIGTGATPLQTRVGSLAASNTTSGGLFVREATALRIAGGAGSYAIDLAGSDGSMAVYTVDGAITIDKAVRSTGAVGHMLLQSGELAEGTVAGISVRANVTSASGSLSVLSADGIDVDDQVVGTAPTLSVAAAGQTLDVEAAASISAEGNARFATAGGTLHLWADTGDVVLGVADAGTGTVSIRAGGRILDGQADDATPAANVIAGSARLGAGTGIGAAGSLLDTQVDTLAAAAAGGPVFLAEANALTVGSVAASTVKRVDTLGAATGTSSDTLALAGATASGALVLQAGGDLVLAQAVTAGGNLRIAGGGTLGVNAAVATTGGSLSATSAGTVTVASTGSFAASGGMLDLQSSGGAVTMADGAFARTDAATLRVQAAGNVTVGLLDARTAADRLGSTSNDALSWGAVSVVAGGAIADNAGETATDVFGYAVRLQAAGGIGAGTEQLETEAGQLAATAGAAGLFLTEASGLEVQQLAAITVDRVGLDGAAVAGPTDATLGGLASGGALTVRTQLGSILVGSSAAVTAAGNLLLDAQGGPSDVWLDSGVSSSAGSISILAAHDLRANADVATTLAGATIDLQAANDLLQAQGTAITANNGNVALDAGGTVTLESVAAGTGGVWVSGATLVDGDGAGDTEVDIAAASAQLRATAGAIGAGNNALETQVATLSAAATGGVFLTESDGVTVDSLQVNVNRVDAAGGTAATAHAAQEDLTGATIVLATLAGDLSLNAGTAGAAVNGTGGGNVRLEAATGALVVAGNVVAGASASLLGDTGVSFQGTGGATAASTLDVEAGAGNVVMAQATVLHASTVRVHASGDVTVGVIDAGAAGSVSISAGGSIADIAGDTATDVIAASLRLQATGGIGAVGEAIETDVAQLSAFAGAAGLFLSEANDLSVAETAAISVQRVGTDGTTLTAVTDGVQDGIASGGVVVLQAASGSIASTAQGTISAAGNVFVQAGTDLSLGALVGSSGGSIGLQAGQDALLNASVQTLANGKTVYVSAGRNVTQAQGTAITTSNGGIAIGAYAGTATIELLSAGTAGVSVGGAAIVDGDAAGDTEVDIVADRLILSSTGGIGAAGAELETSVATLAVQASGNVFITEADAVALDAATVSVQLLDATGVAQDLTSPPYSGLSGANVVLRTLAGGITGAAGASVAVTGNLLLQAGGATSDLVLRGTTSAAGAASLLAGRDVTLTSSVTTTTAGSTIDVQAQGRIDAQQGSAISATDANVQLVALGGSVTLESVAAGTGTVRISGTNIVDGDTGVGETEVDITAAKLLLTATSNAGTGANPLETTVGTLSANAGSLVGILETDGLVLDTVSASVNRVAADGSATATATTTQSNVSGTTVTVRTVDGALAAMAGGAVTASGNVLLKAGGATGDVSLGAAVTSSGGNISVDAGRDLSQGAAITTAGAGKTIDLVAAGALTQQQGSTLATTNGHASLAAGGVLTIESVSAGIGRVSLVGASLVDGDAAGDTEVDVLAAGVRAKATAGGIGSAANPLETTISTLSAVATGDVFVTETDAVDLSAVAVSVNRVGSNGADAVVNLGSQSNVSGATVVVHTLGGSLTSQATGAVSASGNLLLQADGGTSDLNLAAAVASSGGHVSLAAGQDVVLGANVMASAAGKSVDVVAGRNFSQAQGTALSTVDGNIGLQAGGSATLESFAAGTGQVRIAAASVVDGDTAANETEVDITASALQLVTTGAVGSGSNALETSVQTLAAAAGGNLFVTETDALTLGSLAVNTQRVGADGTAGATANGATAGLAGATTVLRSVGGSIDSLAGAAVAATGNLLLKAAGAASDLVLRGSVTAAGDLTLDAARDLTLSGAVSATGAGRSLVLTAGRDLLQNQGASAASTNGTLVVTATGNATLESLAAGTGTVRIAAAAVIDGDAAGDTEVDVTGGALGIVTTGAVGASGNALETAVGTLALQAGGAAFVTEADALLADTVGGTAQRVGADGSSQALALAALSNLTTGGALVLQTAAGALTTAAGGAVSAGGNLLLAAGGAGSDLTLGAAVASSGGDVSVLAGRDLLANAGISANGAGATIDLSAQRDFTQAQGTQAASNGGNIAVTAQTGAATIESLAAGTGGVWVSAASIVDGDAAGDAEVDISGAAAQLNAGGALGAAGNALETSVATVAARAGAGLFLTESDALTVGSVAIDVRRVDATGASTSTAHAADAGLVGATVVLRTVAGALTTQGAVTATGNLLLQAGGAAGDLAIQGATSATGAMSLAAGRDFTLTAGVATTGGSIDVAAQGAITAAEGSTIGSGNGNVLLQAGGDVTIDTVNAGTGMVRIAGANVIDGDTAAGETEVDVVATQLQVNATGAVGAAGNALETTVGTLAVTAGGSITLAESDDLSIASVTFAGVNRVGADGTTGLAGGATQSGIAGGGAVTLTTGGALAIAASTTVASTGGAIVLGAQGDVTLAANSAVTTTGTGTIDVTSATGDVMMDPDTSSLATGSGDIHVTAEGDIQPGALVTQGKAYLDARNGSVLIRGDLQRNGDDIDLFGNDLVIEVPVASPGGTLRIGPLNAGTTVVIGDTIPGGGAALQVDTGELALLQDGFAQIAVGGSLANTHVVLDGATSPLVFHDPLLLTATGAGGSVAVNGSVSGDTLTVADSGTATTFSDATLALQGDVLVQDQLTVAGANTIAAGQGGSGTLHLTQTVTGAGGAADTLALSANGGDVALDGAVSNLDGLTVSQAANVTFGAAVNLTGDLVIEATGTVTFNGPLTLANGAHLIVRGGGRVVFNAGADLGTGDALLQVSAIQANGGAGSLRGQGLLQVQGTTAAQAIHVGGGTAAAGELVVGDDLLRAVGSGFQALQIGAGATAGAGALTLGDADLSVTASPVRLLGSTIAVAANGAGVRVGTDLTLHAAGAVTVAGQVLATASADLAFTSDTGAVTMAAGAQVTSAGGHIALDAATGLAVAGLDARDGSGGAGTVSLRTATGQVADANADAAVDVYAQAVDVTGRGFASGDAAVLEVSAPIVRVDAAGGLVLRESGTDGRVYFNVLHGADVEQVLVAVGASQRITTDPDAFVAGGGLQQLANASSAGRGGAQAAAALSPSWVSLDGVNTGVQGYLGSVGGQSLDAGLTLSQRLASEGAVSFASGQAAAGVNGLDYWTESLAV